MKVTLNVKEPFWEDFETSFFYFLGLIKLVNAKGSVTEKEGMSDVMNNKSEKQSCSSWA